VIIKSFSDPVFLPAPPTPFAAEAEMASVSSMKSEISGVFKLTQVEHLSSGRLVWDGKRRSLNEALVLDGALYPIVYQPKSFDGRNLALRIEVWRHEARDAAARKPKARERGEDFDSAWGEAEKIMDTEMAMGLDDPVVLGFPVNGQAFFLTLQIDKPSPEAVAKDWHKAPEGDPDGLFGFFIPPKPVFQVKPVYPETCKSKRIEGTVTVQIRTNREGLVERARVWQKAHPDLDKSSLEALRQWRFEPRLVKSTFGKPRPVPALFFMSVNFKLHEASATPPPTQEKKRGPDGKYLQTIGRPGQGPGELQSAFSLDIDEQGLLYIAEARNLRLQIFDLAGKPLRQIKLKTFGIYKIRRLPSGLIVKGGGLGLREAMEKPKKLPPLLELIDLNGKIKKAFEEPTDYKDALVNSTANNFELDTDAEGNIYLSFWYQNRIDKYSPDGTPLWRADRALNYGTEVIDKGFIERSETGTSTQMPTMNMVSMGIAADGKGRVWINTFNRQMAKEEQTTTMTVGGATRRIQEGKIAKMDIHKLEVFDADGVLLGEIPLNHLAHGIRIFGETLFVWERNNAMFYQYKIVEK
jgi:TonB family protein